MKILAAMGTSRRLAIVLLLHALLVTGCHEEPSIVRQRVPKLKAPPVSDGMLAALVPIGDNGWFFKLTGSKEAVSAEADRFQELLKSLKVDGDRPVWTTPDGWEEEDGSGMRAATFKIASGDESLECSVIPLPARGGAAASDDYLLDNVNRWRKQLGLAAWSAEELKTKLASEENIYRIELDSGIPVTWVQFEGSPTEGGMPPFAGSAPFASSGSDSGAPSGTSGSGAPKAAGPPVAGAGRDSRSVAEVAEIPEMSFRVPDGWTPGPLKPFRRISWNVESDGATGEAYISALGAAGADVTRNVNRWRGQAGLPAIGDPAELAETIEKIEIGGKAADFVVLQGSDPRKTILGAIVVHDGTGWFFKMTGEAAAKPDQQAAFRKFLQSIEFN